MVYGFPSRNYSRVFWIPHGMLLEGLVRDEGWYFWDKQGKLDSGPFQTEEEAGKFARGKPPLYVIHNSGDNSYWSNEDGWGDLTSATRFAPEEKQQFHLIPLGGVYMREDRAIAKAAVLGRPLELGETVVPVIYELDPETGEANGTVHFFCCTGCRSQSHYKEPDASNYGDNPLSLIPQGTKCEFCAALIQPVTETTSHEDRTIVIEVFQGCVSAVHNLPEGWGYRVDDKDVPDDFDDGRDPGDEED